jgi:hypothetical protein
MGLGARAGIAAEPDRWALLHAVSHADQSAASCQVHVGGYRSVGAPNIDEVLLAQPPPAVLVALFDEEHCAASTGDDGRADGHRKVVGVLDNRAGGVRSWAAVALTYDEGGANRVG